MTISGSGSAEPSRIAGGNVEKLQQSRAYDVAMRLPLLGWAMFAAIVSSADLSGYIGKSPRGLPDAVFAINVAMRLSTIAFLILIAASVVLRARPAEKARGVEPRLSALLGTFLVYAFPLFPRRELSPLAEIVSTLMILSGAACAVFVLSQLGRSFSIMAEARRLVTSGVYRFVRHPLYLVEELAVAGLVLQFLSYWTALILVVQIAFQLRRMRNEEAILAETFPEYTAYSARTARLIPGVY
jgi:protein-S-isoprenylcysteine O-methyltransferase Ste14